MTNFDDADTLGKWVFDPTDYSGPRLNILNTMGFAKDPTLNKRIESLNLNKLFDSYPGDSHRLAYIKEAKRLTRDAAKGLSKPYVYVGFLNATVQKVLNIDQSDHAFELTLDPYEEDGVSNKAHCQIELLVRNNGTYQRAVAVFVKNKLQESFGEALIKPD